MTGYNYVEQLDIYDMLYARKSYCGGSLRSFKFSNTLPTIAHHQNVTFWPILAMNAVKLPASWAVQVRGEKYAATLSVSQEQQLSEQLQGIRLHISELHGLVLSAAKDLAPLSLQAMQSCISAIAKEAAIAKELAEILKACTVPLQRTDAFCKVL